MLHLQEPSAWKQNVIFSSELEHLFFLKFPYSAVPLVYQLFFPKSADFGRYSEYLLT